MTANVGPSALAKWSYSGPKVLFLEVRDRQNRRYRTHLPLNLPRGADYAAGWKWTENLCVAPGDYEIAAAIYDTGSKEHSLRRAKLHVPELHNDPLPGAWIGLPSVENGERACWDTRLSLPLKTEKPVQIDLIVNTPVDANTGIGARLMVISEMEISNGSMTATALDLENRKVSTQNVVGVLDLNSFLGPLPNDSRYMVDAHALDIDAEGAQFFVSEIRKRVELATPEAQHVLIILSDRKSSPKRENFEPIQAAPAPGTRVFYVRCDPSPSYWSPDAQGATILMGLNGIMIAPPPVPPPAHRPDSLERTLDPLHPRLFDVTTPIEFRRALAEIMSDISQQK